MLGAVIVPGPRERECELARELGQIYESVVPLLPLIADHTAVDHTDKHSSFGQ